jgi:hypothetical protein
MQHKSADQFSFIVNHPYAGWIAFAIALVLCLSFVVWHFKREADFSRETLATVRQIDSTETVNLIPRKPSLLRTEIDFPHYHLDSASNMSSEETWDDEFETTYLQRSQRAPRFVKSSRKYMMYYPKSRQNFQPILNAASIGESVLKVSDLNKGPTSSKKLIMDISSVSTASENAVPASRPMSYREIKRNGGMTPVVLGVLHPV